ncbi:MAG: DMT family transporter [Pseudomonadota bacterium]
MQLFPDTLRYALIMLAAGIGIPGLAALNAALGTRLGNPVAAAVCLFLIALLVSLVALGFAGLPARGAFTGVPKHLFLAGVLIAFYVLSVTFVAPRFGVGNAVFFVLLGQMISAAAIDHFGLFGAVQTPMTLTRAGGIAMMAGGLFVIQRAG